LLQLPAPAISVCPCTGCPTISGWTVEITAAEPLPTGPTSEEYTGLFVPFADTFTVTASVLPASNLTSR
jgi:hypothetical protein